MMDCDLCGKPVEAGQPRFGGNGRGDRTGSPMGFERHYTCHTEKFGRPDPRPTSQLFAELRGAISNPTVAIEPKTRPAVKVPLVTKGEHNRSENAGRPFRLYNFVSEMGKRRASCDCVFCHTTFTVYVWSLSGGGKKCPGCGAMYGGYGVAYPLVGNEDM